MTNMTSSRQKSCEACTKAKRRCDLKSPCSRCTQRQLACIYTTLRQLPTPPAAHDTRAVPGGDVSVDLRRYGPDSLQLTDHDPHSEFDLGRDSSSYDPSPANIDPNLDPNNDSEDWRTNTAHNSDQYANSHKLRIEEILRTGPDYRRADYHKTNTAWDKFTYETFSDPNSRFSCTLSIVKEFHREFASGCQTLWLHPRLYKNGMPENMLAAFTACVLYANKTPANEALVHRVIEQNVERLLQPEFVDTVEEHLARTQALLLYQSMRLFDSNIRQRSLAESHMGLFERWTDLLGDLRDVLPDLASSSDQTPATWESWIHAESLKRTVMFAYSLITLYHMLKQENRETGGWMRGHPWTISRHLWEAPSSFDFFCAWREKPHFHIRCMDLEDFLKQGRAEDVDDFARSMLVTYMGLDETKQWFKERGSTY